MATTKQEELHPFFYPRSIAIIGASINEHNLASQYLRELQEFGFRACLRKLFGQKTLPLI